MKKIVMFAISMQIIPSIFCSDQQIEQNRQDKYHYPLNNDEPLETFKIACYKGNLPPAKVAKILEYTRVEKLNTSSSCGPVIKISFVRAKDEKPSRLTKYFFQKEEINKEIYDMTSTIDWFSRLYQETKNQESYPREYLIKYNNDESEPVRILGEATPPKIIEKNKKRRETLIEYMRNLEYTQEEVVTFGNNFLQQQKMNFLEGFIYAKDVNPEKLNEIFNDYTVKILQTNSKLIEPEHTLLIWEISKSNFSLDHSHVHFIKKASEQIAKKIGAKIAFTLQEVNCFFNFFNYMRQKTNFILDEKKQGTIGWWQRYLLCKAVDCAVSQGTPLNDSQSPFTSKLFTEDELCSNKDFRIFDAELKELLDGKQYLQKNRDKATSFGKSKDTNCTFFFETIKSALSESFPLRYSTLVKFIQEETKDHLDDKNLKVLLATALENAKDIESKSNDIKLTTDITPIGYFNRQQEQINLNNMVFSANYYPSFLKTKPSSATKKGIIQYIYYRMVMLFESTLRSLNEENLPNWARSTDDTQQLKEKIHILYIQTQTLKNNIWKIKKIKDI